MKLHEDKLAFLNIINLIHEVRRQVTHFHV